MSIPGGSGEVSVHQMASHFPSLPTIAWLRSLLSVVQQGAPMKRTSYDERDACLSQGMRTQPDREAQRLTQSAREVGGREPFCQV